MSAPLVKLTLEIPVANHKVVSMAGTVFYCQSATLGFKVAFDSEPECDFNYGWKRQTPFSKMVFYNPNTVAITVVFYVGQDSLDFIGTDMMKNAATYVLGNKNTGSVYLDAVARTPNVDDGAVTNLASAVSILGVHSGHLRKHIIFTVDAGSNALFVFDSFGNVAARISPGNIVLLETSDTLRVLGDGGSTRFFICETYYAN